LFHRVEISLVPRLAFEVFGFLGQLGAALFEGCLADICEDFTASSSYVVSVLWANNLVQGWGGLGREHDRLIPKESSRVR